MSLRPTSATRQNGYKKGVSLDEARRKREEKLVQIRKNKKQDSLKKRRDGSLLNDNARLHHVQPKLEHLPLMVQAVSSSDSSWQLEATTQFRKLLSTDICEDQCLPIDEVVGAGVVPRFVEFLDEDCFPQLQIEAAWALANIASGRLDHIQLIIQLGSIPKFVRLLGSSVADVREQAVWALGNIAGDSPNCRDHVLSGGALVPLLAQLDGHPKLTPIRSTTWTLSNLCRGKPPPPFEQVKPALPALRHLIYSEDEEVLIDACWALSFISDGSNQNIDFVIEAGVCPRLLELLVHPSPVVLVPTLQTLGNIVSGNDAQTQFVIDNQGLPPLYEILTKNCERSVKKEACWVISNITAGNRSQIQAVLKANIIPPVVSLLQHAEFEIKKEAAWAISNAISGGSHEQIRYLVSQGCIKPLCDLLICSDPQIIMVCLEGVGSILESGEMNKELGIYRVNVYLPMVDECEGLDKIEDLQRHKNNEVYEQAVKILEKYWNKEENEEEEEEEELHSIYFGADTEFNIGRLSLS
ncbi:importin subunit alpha-4-like isoform X1 [Rhodamnia argentea]|uniref:Importin subunit alpha n=1 Tax=Rhodamnia argentea TaxID=178133 RepID=A0A8B8NEW1_9MYRT|nr:importin subunit alpha-4-like isoform X1 [Rhodamnia argentea]